MPIREILAISGSLRARSSNTELLKAAALVASASLRVGLYSGLDSLPHFNPDRDAEGSVAPPEVVELRSRVADMVAGRALPRERPGGYHRAHRQR